MNVLRAFQASLLGATLLAASACQPPAAEGPAPLSAPAPAPRADSAMEMWLSQHPAVANAIVWETERGPIPWAQWDDGRRRSLEEAFLAESAALQGRGDPNGFPLQDPPTNILAWSHGQTVLSPVEAWRLYVAHVGHSLALEMQRAVPWSIANDSPPSLEALLDGRSMFVWNREFSGYQVEWEHSGWVVPAPPAVELGFLMRERLLGQTRLATIEAMVGWSFRLHHMRGNFDIDNAEQIWQYRGYAPVSRVLAGVGPQQDHITAGCWGTTGLFIAVLRAANIPVRLVNVQGAQIAGRAPCSHAQPYFVSEGRYLSHGDDPYSQHITSLGVGALHPGRLLIDEATWKAWYGQGVDRTAMCANIGRQALEVALEEMPPYVLDAYCEDERRHNDRRSGKVARAFATDMPGTAFPHERLERARLWERLAEKARHTGHCSRNPHAHRPAP
jgi:hypothetical protein